MKVRYKSVYQDKVVPVPEFAHRGDAGADLRAVTYKYDEKTGNHIYGTGIALEVPEGYVALLFPRSSNRNTDCYMTNHVGVIDSGYRGEVMVTFKCRDKKYADIDFKPYNIGDKICQIIIIPYPEIEYEKADELSDTERGTGGHGSTGR